VAKHARASRATIRLAASGDGLEFSVTDDGAGFPAAAQRHGSGLQGMSDRLAAHGGTLDICSEPGQGTTITGRLPALPAGHDPAGNGARRAVSRA
jgi:signal transduction histidine kinase